MCEPGKTALLLLAHGSLLCGAADTVSAHAERLRQTAEFCTVEVGFLNYSTPSFYQALCNCAATGATSILVLPYFLVSGRFVSEEIPRLIETARRDYPALRIVLARAIEDADLLAQMIMHQARTALPPQVWRTDLVCQAEACRGSAECPMYGTGFCPLEADAQAAHS